ncbi:MAG: glutaredoxin family protein [Candidatus Nanoarchaeia archaeon]|nr:glutaredoxin family protein [Candidatus Nanoarchaeia archaeon]MDD5238900.1 glutaredoxin family protein [Candidatus Nanoarchaeia archaeon]
MIKKQEIIVYSTPTCPFCVRAKDFLKKNKFQFKEINVAEDHEAAQFMIEKTQQMGVPVIQIGNEFVTGFDEIKLKILLGLK